MYKIQITRLLLLISFALAMAAPGMAQSPDSRRSNGCERSTLTAKASNFIDLESLARAEQRVEALRSQLFDLQMRELSLQGRIDELDYRLTPEAIQRALAFVGSVRPMDELRNSLRVRLEKEKARLNRELELLQSRMQHLESAIQDGESEVDRLNARIGAP